MFKIQPEKEEISKYVQEKGLQVPCLLCSWNIEGYCNNACYKRLEDCIDYSVFIEIIKEAILKDRR